MPAIQTIIPVRGREFWDSLDPENMRQVLEAVKEEFDRPEPAYELHYFGCGQSTASLGCCGVWSRQPCYRDCLVFLLRGAFVIEGQGRVEETGCAYVVKNEERIGLCAHTTIVVMEEGEQRGVCRKWTEEMREKILAAEKRPKKLRKSKFAYSNDPRCAQM